MATPTDVDTSAPVLAHHEVKIRVQMRVELSKRE